MLWKDAALPEGVEDLRDGQIVEGDEVTLVPVHTPGHASDHLCYWLPEERALFSGDLILNGSTSVIPDEDGDLGQYMASLERVRALGVRRIYPAHGAVIEDGPGKIAEYVEHRLLRERQILDAMGGGARNPLSCPRLRHLVSPRCERGQSAATRNCRRRATPDAH